jgi:hypothetical protein
MPSCLIDHIGANVARMTGFLFSAEIPARSTIDRVPPHLRRDPQIRAKSGLHE